MEAMINDLVALFTDSNAVVNVSAIIMALIYIAREVGVVLIRRKLNIKDVQVDELKEVILLQGEQIGTLTAEMKSSRNATKLLSAMILNGFQGSKIPAEYKDLLTKNWSAIDNLLDDASIQVLPQLLEKAEEVKETFFDKAKELVGDSEVLETIIDEAEEFVDKVIEEAPSYLEELLVKDEA